jgi:hypothetical protein
MEFMEKILLNLEKGTARIRRIRISLIDYGDWAVPDPL